MREVIASIMTPAHVISLDVALCSLFPNESVNCVVYAHWPGLPQIEAMLTDIFKKMLGTSPHHFQFVTDLEAVKSRRQASHFLYSHDVSSDAVHILCEAMPSARRVCLGDALGMVCDRTYQIELVVTGKKPSLQEMRRRKFKRLFKRIFDRRSIVFNESIIPDLASLILPVDQTGTTLMGVKLHVPDKDLVLRILKRMSSSFAELNRFLSKAVPVSSAPGNKPTLVLLMENIAEGGTMSFDTEVEMYASMIQGAAPMGATIILKGHPGETLDREAPIREILGDRFDVVAVPPEFKRIPVELWTEIVDRVEFISLSYPSLSLHYLFGKKVINPANDEFFKRWIDPKFWESYKDGLKLYQEPLRKIPTWNRNSLLVKGPI